MVKENNEYLNALRSKGVSDVVMSSSSRVQIKNKQENRCAKCHKELKPFMYKFVENPVTKQKEIICSDCAIPIAKKR
jgi:uncharacterized CHY-type Zn-finger protein